MKKIITGEELVEKKRQAINLICNAVGSTLGPTGNNVLINNSEQAPFITNDGVTIASNIESEEEDINTILEIIKEASLKTNELVGDGTTTTLVLAKSILNQGLEEIKKGMIPIVLKEELLTLSEKIEKEIEKKKKTPQEKDYYAIARTASNSKEIGDYLTEQFLKMKNTSSIRIEEGDKEHTYSVLRKGYTMEINNISSLYFQKNKKIVLEDCIILILKGYLESLEPIHEIIEESVERKRPLIILTEEMDNTISQELLTYFLTYQYPVLAIPLPDYASHREKIESDIQILSKATIKNIEYEKVFIQDVGIIPKVEITKEEITLEVGKVPETLIKNIQEELKETKEEFEKEFIENRLSKLTDGILTIYVSAPTKTEVKEKRMRYEDALKSLSVAKEGVVPGEGLLFLELSEQLQEKTIAEKILKKALQEPFLQIIENTGKNKEELFSLIEKENYQKIYNFSTNQLENKETTLILDSVKVIQTALKNAISISSLLLTTNYLVINEKEKPKPEF